MQSGDVAIVPLDQIHLQAYDLRCLLAPGVGKDVLLGSEQSCGDRGVTA